MMIPDQMTVALQDPVIPQHPPSMYNYCNAFNASMSDVVNISGTTMEGGNQPFYYHPPPPQMLAPFSQSALAGNNNSSAMQKRSFSLPCVRLDLQHQHSNQITTGEDEELLLGLGTHIINNEAEGRISRSNSISSRSGIYSQVSHDRGL